MSVEQASREVDELTQRYKETLQNISKISRTSDEDDLSELAITIRDSLNSLKEDLECLDITIDLLGSVWPESEENKQKLQLYVQSQRLSEDLKSARSSFRRAQLQAKRAKDVARAQEREERLRLLREKYSKTAPSQSSNDLSHSNGDIATSQTLPPLSRRNKQKAELTEDDMLVNASSDVLAALRRTCASMAHEVERSYFAQELLASSTQDLEQLNDEYSGLNGKLKASKELVSQLMKSNKSDTWYLTNARNLLLVVAAWLVWRRLLWGPTWWLLWMPLKIMYMTMMVIVRPLGLSYDRSVDAAEPGITSGESLRIVHSASRSAAPLPVSQAIESRVHSGSDPSKDGSLSQKIGRMVEEAEKLVRGDGTELESSDQPRNPKKRVMDIVDELGQEEQFDDAQEYIESERSRDEL